MKILGLGDHVIDRYRNLQKVYPGGNALNVAVNAAMLHHEAAYLGVFGADVYSSFIMDFLEKQHVSIKNCERKPYATTKQCVEDVKDGERRFLYVDLGHEWAGALRLRQEHLTYIEEFDAVLTSCNAKMEEQIRLLKDYHGILSYDFGEKEKYHQKAYLDLIVPYADILQFSMSGCTQEEITRFVQTLPQDKLILITRGKEATLLFANGACISYAQTIVKAVDTMGAGDAFITAFVCSLLEQGWKKHSACKETMISQALQSGARQAASICRMHGGFCTNYHGLEAVIFPMDAVLVSEEQARQRLLCECLQAHGKTLKKNDIQMLCRCSKADEDRMLAAYLDTSIEVIREWKAAYITQHPVDCQKIEIDRRKGILERLQKAGIVLVLISDLPASIAEEILRDHGYEGYFGLIVSERQLCSFKPNSNIYEYCIEKLSIDKEHIRVVEGSAHGIAAASAAELHILQYPQDTQDVRFEWIEAVCCSYEEIWDALKKHM